MKFTVIDTKTGEYPNLWEIALKEEWAKSLCYCDMEGFAVEEDGTLFLMDECGRYEYPPEGRFTIAPLVETNADRIRAMGDEELAEFVAQQRFCTLGPIADKLGIDITQMLVKCRDIMLDWLRQEVEGGE